MVYPSLGRSFRRVRRAGVPVRRGSNLPRVGDHNRVLVVDLVRRNAGISRVEMSEQTGLTGQTISNICAHLTDQGLIREIGRASYGTGKWRTVYEVVPESRCAVGLHIDAARTVLALVDLAGQVVDRQSILTPATDDPRDAIDAITTEVRSIVARNAIPRPRLSGLGVASPGPINMGPGIVIAPPNLRGWTDVRLRDDLELGLGIPVQLEKDTVAVATGEVWAGRVPSDDFAFVYLGTGSGVGLVLGGEVMHGASGNLGNFGHLQGDPDGPICSCGGRGCLAVTAMPIHLVTAGRDAGLLEPFDPDDAATIERALAHLCRLADDGAAEARAIVEGAARGFARVAANLTNTLDLDTVVFGGPNWRYLAPTFMSIVPGMIAALHIFRDVHAVEVRGTSLGEDVGPIGAASLVLASAVSARPDHLFLPV